MKVPPLRTVTLWEGLEWESGAGVAGPGVRVLRARERRMGC